MFERERKVYIIDTVMFILLVKYVFLKNVYGKFSIVSMCICERKEEIEIERDYLNVCFTPLKI